MKSMVIAGTVALTLAAMPAFAQAQKSRTQSGSADLTFVMDAANGGMAEVELGRLAAQKASSDEVKKFAQRMVDDHGKGNDELKSLAQTKNITLPADVDTKDKALENRLSKLSGAAFDKAYMQAMLADHRKDVAAFKRESQSGKDPDVKAWAAKTLPTLEDHLKEAQQASKSAVATSGTKPATGTTGAGRTGTTNPPAPTTPTTPPPAPKR